MRSVALCIAVVAAGCTQDIGIIGKDDDVNLGEDSDPSGGLDSDSEGKPRDTSEGPIDEDPIAPARLPIYAHTRNTLYSVDPEGGAVTLIGTFLTASGSKPEIVDIAIDLAGRLYGGSLGKGGVGRAVYRIDPTTGALESVCEMAVELTAMTFTSDGRLVLGGDDVLQVVDLAANCRVTTVFTANGYETSGDVVGLPDGLIYWTVRGSGQDKLAVVDPDDASTARIIGNLGVDRLFGIGFDEAEGALYGFSADGEIVRIEPKTGVTEILAADKAYGWWGATTNPVLWAP